MTLCCCLFFFFFSSRRRHTRWNCDWSSDVCSSDLKLRKGYAEIAAANLTITPARRAQVDFSDSIRSNVAEIVRSEERRVGKSVDLGGRRIIKKKKKKNDQNVNA